MLLYPFKTIWLKTSSERQILAELIAEQTYLSDADYRRRDKMTKFFYGMVNENEFMLENIGNKRIPDFFEGDIVGVGEETYVKLKMGALQHTRIYFMYWVLLLTGVVFLLRAFLGIDIVDTEIVYLFSGVILILLGYGFYFLRQFHRRAGSGIDFFRGLLQAEWVDIQEVPSIFRR